MDAGPRLRPARKALAWVVRERRASFKRWEPYDDLRSDALFPGPDSMDGPLEVLEAHNVVRAAPLPLKQGPGRKPAQVYLVNPTVLSQHASG